LSSWNPFIQAIERPVLLANHVGKCRGQKKPRRTQTSSARRLYAPPDWMLVSHNVHKGHASFSLTLVTRHLSLVTSLGNGDETVTLVIFAPALHSASNLTVVLSSLSL
jgi:hypothetical protein